MLTFDFILKCFVVLLGFIVTFGLINEKTLRLPSEIWLMLSAFAAGLAIYLFNQLGWITLFQTTPRELLAAGFSEYLLEGVLCFMLFSGASQLCFQDIRRHIRITSFLALLSTLLATVVYGVLFYLLCLLLRLNIGFMPCLLLGCIISPTDPIAAMSILHKCGLPKDTGVVIESEALFNDGVGVALFVCFSGIISGSQEGGFVMVLLKELLGAVVVGFTVSFLLYFIFKATKDSSRQIFVSLLSVALSYVLCEAFGFSGAIASVVCGIFYATKLSGQEQEAPERFRDYRSFWSIIDTLLNSILYVILGLSFPAMLRMPYFVILAVAAIIINLLARGGSIFAASLICRPLPDGAKRGPFTVLLTWSGLRGGLCLALAISTSSLFGEEAYNIVMGVTYTVVFFTTIVQGLTVGKVYKKLYR